MIPSIKYNALRMVSIDELNNFELPGSIIKDAWYLQNAGNEHYRLLAYACQGLDLVFDVGTYRGFSSLAMSTANKVVSYDVNDKRVTQDKENIEYVIGDVLKDDRLFKSDLIFIDTYHDGDFENKFLDVVPVGWTGLLILDDIHFNNEMNDVWDRVKRLATAYEDMTRKGHHSGTGVAYFE